MSTSAPAVRADPVLVDPELDERLARDAIVCVPLVVPAVLERVEAAYWELVPPGESGIVLDYLRRDPVLKRRLAALMEPIWDEVVPRLFVHHYPVYTSFVVKHPGEGSSLYLHRDLHVDDERRRRTYAMWMPLVDTGPELDNGPLAFVPGSEAVRYGSFGPNAVGTFSPYDDDLCERLEPMTVPAGSALVYDARLLHASAPNRTERVRVAVGCLLARRDQPVTQVFATGRRHRRLHEVDRDYFLDHAPADIATEGMPERFPVLEEYDEEPATTTEAVLGPVLGEGAVRAVVVPEDLRAVAGARRPLRTRRLGPPSHRHDLEIAAADLPSVGPTVAGGVAASTGHPVGALDLVRGRRRVGAVPAIVPDPVVPLSGLRTVDATLVVVDAGGRLALTAPPSGRRHELVVLECPAVRSGAATDGEVAELDLGTALDLPAGADLHLWNEGPGPLVVVVRARSGRTP